MLLCSCSAACFVTSFYRWGNQTDAAGIRQDRSLIAFGRCTDTYADSRDDYKGMTAFAMFTTLTAIGAAIAERYNMPETNRNMMPATGVALAAEQDGFM
jgi:hypothetical protein